MPGYDRSGPHGIGPRTGRGQGRCGQPTERTRAVEDGHQDEDAGRYGRRQGGGGRFGGGGGERRRGFGTGRRARGAADGDIEPGRRQGFLRKRIEELAQELARMKQLLSKDAQDGAPE